MPARITILLTLILASSVVSALYPAGEPRCAFCGVDLCAAEQHQDACPFLEKPAQQKPAQQTMNGKSTEKLGGGLHKKNSIVKQHANLEIDKIEDIITSYCDNLLSRLEHKRYTLGATLYDEPECHDDGFVVVCGADGYYSIWNDNAKHWQFSEPQGSTLIKMILYNARAACVQRWLQGKWCIVDLAPQGKYQSAYKNDIIVNYEYDNVKCVAKGSPIAVGKYHKRDMRWGLVTRVEGSDRWAHTVDDTWSDMDILPIGDKSFAIAHSEGYVTLFNTYGKRITNQGFARIIPLAQVDGKIYFVVDDNGKLGMMAEDGTMTAECRYEDFKIDTEGIKVLSNNSWIPYQPTK